MDVSVENLHVDIEALSPGLSCSKIDQIINLYPVDSTISFPNTNPLDCDFPSG